MILSHDELVGSFDDEEWFTCETRLNAVTIIQGLILLYVKRGESREKVIK